jgi:hypothetical protein
LLCACETPAQDEAFVDVTGGPPVRFDDLVFSPSIDRIIATGRETGLVVLIHPDTLERTVVDLGARTDPASADAIEGLGVVLDRTGERVSTFDPESGEIMMTMDLDLFTDFVRFAPNGEIWVTEPDLERIEIFEAGAGGALTSIATISIPGRPEGLVFDTTHGVAYVHNENDGALYSVDIEDRVVLDEWGMGCGTIAHGIPKVDEEREIVFAGCGATEVVSFSATGSELARFALDEGTTILAYAPMLERFYLRADPGDELVVLSVADDGTFNELGRRSAPRDGHCVTTDDRGNVWLCDQPRGGVIRWRDPF